MYKTSAIIKNMNTLYAFLYRSIYTYVEAILYNSSFTKSLSRDLVLSKANVWVILKF